MRKDGSGQAVWRMAMLGWRRRRVQKEAQALSADHSRATLREGKVKQHIEIRAQGPSGAGGVCQAPGPEDSTSMGRKRDCEHETAQRWGKPCMGEIRRHGDLLDAVSGASKVAV